jgi:hypothetical protein
MIFGHQESRTTVLVQKCSRLWIMFATSGLCDSCLKKTRNMSVYSLKRVSDKWVERMLAYLPWVFNLKNKGAPLQIHKCTVCTQPWYEYLPPVNCVQLYPPIA